MHSNGTLPLDAPLDTRCGYALNVQKMIPLINLPGFYTNGYPFPRQIDFQAVHQNEQKVSSWANKKYLLGVSVCFRKKQNKIMSHYYHGNWHDCFYLLHRQFTNSLTSHKQFCNTI